MQPKPRLNTRRDKRSGVVGTSAGGNIRTVKTKLVSVFATSSVVPICDEPDDCRIIGELLQMTGGCVV